MQTSYVQYYETKTFAALPFQVGTSRNWLKKKAKSTLVRLRFYAQCRQRSYKSRILRMRITRFI